MNGGWYFKKVAKVKGVISGRMASGGKGIQEDLSCQADLNGWVLNQKKIYFELLCPLPRDAPPRAFDVMNATFPQLINTAVRNQRFGSGPLAQDPTFGTHE